MQSLMKKQIYSPKNVGPHNTVRLSTMGAGSSEEVHERAYRDWAKGQVCRQDDFALVTLERYSTQCNNIAHTKQDDYIKFNFWLSGRHTTVLDGYGEYEHDCPEIFVTAGPPEMTKVDIINRDTPVAVVAMCLQRDFFPVHMGLGPDELPEQLRAIVQPAVMPYTFQRYPLTPDLAAAARAILAAPPAIRSQPLYGRAKAVELMCLMLGQMKEGGSSNLNRQMNRRHEARLMETRDLLTRRYGETLTLEQIAKEIGINRMALTTGFRQLFGLSVYDFIHKQRMEHAFRLLQEDTRTITQIAAGVGYTHACNFSTAFQAYYGCTPLKLRRASHT
jgi:AraC-like DNA-binding protein